MIELGSHFDRAPIQWKNFIKFIKNKHALAWDYLNTAQLYQLMRDELKPFKGDMLHDNNGHFTIQFDDEKYETMFLMKWS